MGQHAILFLRKVTVIFTNILYLRATKKSFILASVFLSESFMGKKKVLWIIIYKLGVPLDVFCTSLLCQVSRALDASMTMRGNLSIS
jgi:hypothetical protein